MKKILVIILAMAAILPVHAARTLKVLAIGNSFSQDAVEQNLWEIANADGRNMVIGNMYIGGCSLERHWKNAESDAAAYAYRKIVKGEKSTTKAFRLSQALKDEKWDVVTIQQSSPASGDPTSYEPYLGQLIDYIKARVPKKTKIMFHRTWAYETNYVRPMFEQYKRDSRTMFEAIVAACAETVPKYGIKIIPAGTAIQNARASEFRNNVTRDGYHLNYAGRYIAALTWYESLTGRSVIGNAYDAPHIEPWMKETAQHCAHMAVLEPEKINRAGSAPHVPDYEAPEITDYILPDPLVMEDGTAVTSPEQWYKARRPELLRLFSEQMFGKAPEKVPYIAFEMVESGEALGGMAVRKQVNIYLSKDRKKCLHLLVYLPAKHDGPVPVFLGINFKGNWTVNEDPAILMPDKETLSRYVIVSSYNRGDAASRWPLELVISNGYGVATFFRGDTDPDYDDGWLNGIASLGFKDGQKWPEPDQWGTIAQWAWSLSRAMDYIETDPDLDASRVAVLGHSRLGKTALWAGATDERFAIVISNCSGAGGAALSRRERGEILQDLNRHFPHWYCQNFHAYSGRESALPFDQHELLALVAPRPLYVASATKDRWADPKGEFLSAWEASKVYEFLGAKGLPTNIWPEAEHPLQEGDVAYHIRTGKHDITAYDWENYIRFADKYFKTSK